MAKHLRYFGEFLSVEGHHNRVALYQESDTAFTPQELDFPADSPLVIEWGEKDKEDVILGSSATLQIISPTDRKFIDLYSIKYGDIRMDVWRDGEFFWTGCIDTEFYTEPYERLNNYIVSLSFSDFGILSREKFDMGVGFKRIKEIIAQAVYKTQCVRTSIESDFDDSFEYSTWVETMDWSKFKLSTTYDKNLGSLNTIKVNVEILQSGYLRTDNFYDEDGTAKTWEEVIRGILQPLGVRMIQLKGMIFLYDYEGLFDSTDDIAQHRVEWTAAAQTMSIDKTYNNVKITWSPYADATDLIADGCWPDSEKIDKNVSALGNLDGVASGTSRVFSYYMPILYNSVDVVEGFSLWTNYTAKNITLTGGRKVFKTAPQYDGDESEGIIAYARCMSYSVSTGVYSWSTVPGSYFPFSAWGTTPSVSLLTTPHAILSPQSATSKMQLRLTLECLVDCRANPFEDPFGICINGFGPTNQGNSCAIAEQVLNTYTKILYIPVKVRFKPEGSTKTYCYTNKQVITNQSFAITTMANAGGTWVEETEDSICYLAYYKIDAKDRIDGSALGGWVANRQAINAHGKTLSTQMQKQDDGQYIAYPTVNGVSKLGEIWVEVMGNGWLFDDPQPTYEAVDLQRLEKLRTALSFALVKTPSLEIISTGLFDQSLNSEDVVYNAEVNADAKEELSLSTICGTYVDGIPTSRGTFYGLDGTQITSMKRGGREGTAEELLCGTLFSQYKERKIALSGECRLDAKRYLSFTEDNQFVGSVYKQFICVSETCDLRSDTADAKFIEFQNDVYDKE